MSMAAKLQDDAREIRTLRAIRREYRRLVRGLIRLEPELVAHAVAGLQRHGERVDLARPVPAPAKHIARAA